MDHLEYERFPTAEPFNQAAKNVGLPEIDYPISIAIRNTFVENLVEEKSLSRGDFYCERVTRSYPNSGVMDLPSFTPLPSP
jgi:hypothetical protein